MNPRWIRGVINNKRGEFAIIISVKGATSRFAHLEKSGWSFAVHVNLLHPPPSLFLYGLLLTLWCFSILGNCYFQISFSLKAIL